MNSVALYGKKDSKAADSTKFGFGRRGMLKSLFGGVVSMAAGDLLLNTVGASVYRRVLSFGQQYPETAIASEELLAWVAAAASSQKATTPEITAWLAAQKQLQTMRNAAVAATTTGGRRAVGGIIEEGIMAAAGTVLKKAVSSSHSSSSVVERESTTTAKTIVDSESVQDGKDDLSSTIIPQNTTTNKRNAIDGVITLDEETPSIRG